MESQTNVQGLQAIVCSSWSFGVYWGSINWNPSKSSALQPVQGLCSRRVFTRAGLEWLLGLPHNFPVAWLVSWVHVWLHSCLSYRVSVYNANKRLLKLFPLWGDERSRNMWEMVIVLRCDGTGDNAVIPPSTSWSLFPWNVGCSTLPKTKEMCLGTDKGKRIVFCHAVPLFTEFILGASKHH